ncbi:hypothetical protein QH494_14165 [Sphingomonas sp. AR_OL41]|uniref:hypothetical protein n=1 Tax=Sphingomonas sp. AR_OL41 TaxID=3042729 RepID=UPI0024813C6D|nr:hypothetical protein [Sphingomonas sp. AR_OL41]MDH7973331.1 hypothetical protein [Sphingomonas sp. AR_OL41]
MIRSWCVVALILGGMASPACAQAPEQIEQLEPGKGEWQLEYYGFFGKVDDDDGNEHSLQAMAGVSEHLALGMDLQTSWSAGRLTVETIAPTALYRWSDPDNDPIGIGIELQAALDRHASLAGAEARLIVEKRSRRWWGQANLILRHTRADGATASSIAYGWSLARAVAPRLWLGAEGSGQAVRLDGDPSLAPVGAHFVGPALTWRPERPGKAEVEIGIAWLRRAAGTGPASTARLFVQLEF